jgi:hypothetical protein
MLCGDLPAKVLCLRRKVFHSRISSNEALQQFKTALMQVIGNNWIGLLPQPAQGKFCAEKTWMKGHSIDFSLFSTICCHFMIVLLN